MKRRFDTELLAALCRDVEKVLGRQMVSSRDFSILSERIFSDLHQPLSVSTLKRVWGHVRSDVSPSRTTLDILAQFVGSMGWDDYCFKYNTSHKHDTAPTPEVSSKSHSRQGGLPAPMWGAGDFFVL